MKKNCTLYGKLKRVHYSVPSTALSKGVKEGKGLKISALNKLLTRLPVLLPQIKDGRN